MAECKQCSKFHTKSCSFKENPIEAYDSACVDFEPKNTSQNRRTEFLEKFKDDYRFYCDRMDPNLMVYIWLDGIWRPIAEAVVLNELTKFYGMDKPDLSKEDVLNYLRGEGQNTEVRPKPPELIAFKNGFYNLETERLESLSPVYFTVNLIPHEFDVNAKCPNWVKFIDEVHHLDDVNFTQEWWGFCLYTAYPKKIVVILIGNTNNGKTVEFDVMIGIIGEENNTAITLQDLTYGEFASSELHHKLTNICDELPSNKIKTIERLNRACAGGIISANKKWGHRFDFKNYAKITYASNEPPEIEQDLDAFWGRLHIIDCPNVFAENPNETKGEKQAIDRETLEQSLLREAPGILNWMLEGLKRLRKNNWKFSYSKSVEEIREYYRIKAQPIICWIEECFKYTADDLDLVLPDDALEACQKWCAEHRIKKAIKRGQFFRVMNDQGYKPMQLRVIDMKRAYQGYQICNAVTPKTSLFAKNSQNIENKQQNIEKSIELGVTPLQNDSILKDHACPSF